MNKEIFFSTENDKTTNKELSKNYFISQGFFLKGETENELNFVRGSYLLNMVTFDPLKWKSNLSLIFSGNSINGVFDISTFGQTVSKKEEELWNSFILNFEESVLHKENFKEKNKQLLSDTKNHSFRLVGWTILGAALFGIPAGVIAFYMKNDLIFFIGTCIGAGSFFTYFQNRK